MKSLVRGGLYGEQVWQTGSMPGGPLKLTSSGIFEPHSSLTRMYACELVSVLGGCCLEFNKCTEEIYRGHFALLGSDDL